MEAVEFQDHVRQHRNRIFSLAYYTLRNRQDAEDVTQEVLIRFWKHRLRLDLGGLPAWLHTVTRNVCRDLARKQRRGVSGREVERQPEELEALPTASADPQAVAEEAQFRQRLQTAVSRLAEPYRSIVILREIQGLKYDEIAAVVDKPLGTVKGYLHRGRRQLRDQLREVNAYVKAC